MKIVSFLATIASFRLRIVQGEDSMNAGPEEFEATKNYYAAVFRNIPYLFEHIISQLQDKPEILEKNDVTFVKRDTHNPKVFSLEDTEENNDKIVKRDVNMNILYDIANHPERYDTKMDRKVSSNLFTNIWYFLQNEAKVFDEENNNNEDRQIVKRAVKDDTNDLYCEQKLNTVNEKLKSYVESVMAKYNNNS